MARGNRRPGQHRRSGGSASAPSEPRVPARARPRRGRALKWVGAALGTSAIVLAVLVTVGNVFFHANINLLQRLGLRAKPAAGRTGAIIYGQNCVGCHGAAGEGGSLAIKGPAFTRGGPLSDLTFAQRVEKISRGRPLNSMPAWKYQLSETEIRKVAAYTQVLSGRAPDASIAPGDVGTPPSPPASQRSGT
jgi:mono/diheme cytochrome c family protein